MIDLDFNFEAELWASKGSGAWYFVTLPVDIAEQIKFFRERHYGFGTIRVRAHIGETEWKTSLFPDKKSQSFFLPVKADVRKKENLSVGNRLSVSIFLDV